MLYFKFKQENQMTFLRPSANFMDRSDINRWADGNIDRCVNIFKQEEHVTVDLSLLN